MPSSQEEYLDALLRGIAEPEAEPEEQNTEAVMADESAAEEEVPVSMDETGILPEGMEFQDIISDDITLGDLVPEELLSDEALPEMLEIQEDQEVQEELSNLDDLLQMAEMELSDAGSVEEELAHMEVPELDISGLELPELETPELELPELELPEMDLPELETPDLELPELELPEMDLPELETPDLELPELELPEMDLPELETPEMELPEELGDLQALLETPEEEPAEEEDDSNVQLTQEEIEQMLAASRGEYVAAPAAEEPSGEMSADTDDLMSLLQGTEDAELQEIHDMLQKADNNEALDDGIADLLQGFSDSGDSGEMASDGSGDKAGEEQNDRERRALEKKRQKEEKAAARKAAKEAKRAAKEAKKASAKNAEKTETADEQEEEDLFAGTQTSTEKIPLPADAAAETDMAELDELLGLIGEGEEPAQPEPDVDEPMELEVDEADIIRAVGEKPKKGWFSRFLDYFTEEDAEEEPLKGTEDVPISDENKAILEEMDKESPKGKKGKKPKKEKNAKNTEDEEENEDGGNSQKGKKVKEKKPKKERVPKEKTPGETGPKLSPKKVIPILLCALSVVLALIVLVHFGGDYTVKKEARNAFYEEDYETCYQNLYGKELSETEQVMFGKSESILHIRLWMREYEYFAGEGKEPEALDILIQSVKDYAPLYEYAQKWNAAAEVREVYEQMLNILADKYHMTETQALEIAAEPDDVEYTKKVITAAGGTVPGSQEQPAAPVIEQLPDMLPEEMEFPENRIEQP